jgi:hypothetical protein
MKSLGLFVLILLMLTPFSLYADPIYVGYGTLTATYSGPTAGGYYTDYDGQAIASYLVPSEEIIFPTNSVDIFCVSRETLNNTYKDYDFYKFTTPDPSDPIEQNYAKATWIADNWIGIIGNSDTAKGEAQKAIWQVLGVLNLVGSDGDDLALFNDAQSHANYVTQNWLWAVSPSMQKPNAYNSQDYLVPYSSGGDVPVPEPSTLILLGLGLFGIGAYRKFRS